VGGGDVRGARAGTSAAGRRRTPQERLAWLDAVVLDLQRSGMLDEWREKKQRAVVAEWKPLSGGRGIRTHGERELLAVFKSD